MKHIYKASVLIYTIFLVILSVFMATVILNVAINLSNEYDVRMLELSLTDTIRSKADVVMKYAKEMNNSGSGYIDVISCPQNLTLSGITQRTANIPTQYVYSGGLIYCQGMHAGNPLFIFFNTNFNNTAYLQYLGIQIPFSSSSFTGTLGDSDSTYVNGALSFPLVSDSIDDNFDSDNYSITSTGTIKYITGFVDNDAQARLNQYGYIVEDAGLYNIFWSNTKVKKFIDNNTSNYDSYFKRLSQVGSGYLYLDVNANFKPVLYKIKKERYDTFNEFEVVQKISGTGQVASIGYLNSDLSIGTTSASGYIFDFINYDYALFLENTSSGVLLYQVRAYDAITGSGVYLNPLKDNLISVLSYWGSHLLIDSDGRLIGDQFEAYGLK